MNVKNLNLKNLIETKIDLKLKTSSLPQNASEKFDQQSND